MKHAANALQPQDGCYTCVLSCSTKFSVQNKFDPFVCINAYNFSGNANNQLTNG